MHPPTGNPQNTDAARMNCCADLSAWYRPASRTTQPPAPRTACSALSNLHNGGALTPDCPIRMSGECNCLHQTALTMQECQPGVQARQDQLKQPSDKWREADDASRTCRSISAPSVAPSSCSGHSIALVPCSCTLLADKRACIVAQLPAE